MGELDGSDVPPWMRSFPTKKELSLATLNTGTMGAAPMNPATINALNFARTAGKPGGPVMAMQGMPSMLGMTGLPGTAANGAGAPLNGNDFGNHCLGGMYGH